MKKNKKDMKYISPFTDYGFKRLFGEEPNKDLLLDFLNELLAEKEGRIESIKYLPNENLPIGVGGRRGIFDIYCINEKGEHFIVEMQKAEQKYFKDRMVFYSTFPIQEQARNQGKDWDFRLNRVYTIGILDFVFEDKKDSRYFHEIYLTEKETGKIFYDKLIYIYLEMPKFHKKEAALKTRFDKWLFLLKNLSELDAIPDFLSEKIFHKVFKTAEIANLSSKEYMRYEFSLNNYRDINNIKNTAFGKGVLKGREEGLEKGLQQGIKEGVEQGKELGREEGIEQGIKEGVEQGKELGREEGIKEGMIKVALNMLVLGQSSQEISKLTGLSIEEIEALS